MTNLQLIILSLIQGLTEFLPVSSSGHLILLSQLTSFPDQGIEIDIAVHIGSFLAVLIYFWKEILNMALGLGKSVCECRRIKSLLLKLSTAKQKDFILNKLPQYDDKLFWMLVVGTIPMVFFGLAMHHFGMEWLRSTKIIGWNILIFGLVLWFADHRLPSTRDIKDMSFKDAFLIGLAQCLALFPGTSRSGITITASRFLKLKRTEAAKFCMLLSMPAIVGAAALIGVEIYESGDLENVQYVLHGIGYSFLASIAAIFIMMRWLKNYTFLPFVVYRVLLGVFLLLYSYGYLPTMP